MSLINQLLKYKNRAPHTVKNRKTGGDKRTPALKTAPQAKGLVVRIRPMTPKKPNSAIRQVAKIRLYNKKRVTARMPGKGYLCTRFNRVLVEGGRANDLPGVSYTVIRGAMDFIPLLYKTKRRRSVYGVSRPKGHSTHIRRCFRHLNYL